MKKTFLFLAFFSFLSLASAQDGWVTFFNTSTTKVMTNSYPGGPATGPIFGPVPSFYFALFVAPTSVLTSTGFDDPNWAFTGYYATNTSFAGRLVAGSINNSDFGLQISGYAVTAQANFLVRGWSADWGYDWTQVKSELDAQTYGSFYAESLIGTDIYLAPNGGPYNNVFGLQSNGYIPGFTLNYMVPEPSALALLGLGAAALALRNRKRARF